MAVAARKIYIDDLLVGNLGFVGGVQVTVPAFGGGSVIVPGFPDVGAFNVSVFSSGDVNGNNAAAGMYACCRAKKINNGDCNRISYNAILNSDLLATWPANQGFQLTHNNAVDNKAITYTVIRLP